MKQCVAVTPNEGRYGFALAGMEQAVADAENVFSTLQELLTGKGYSLVFVDERLLQAVDAAQLRALENRGQAVIISLPAPEEGEMEEDYALQLIRRAVGYHVRLHL